MKTDRSPFKNTRFHMHSHYFAKIWWGRTSTTPSWNTKWTPAYFLRCPGVAQGWGWWPVLRLLPPPESITSNAYIAHGFFGVKSTYDMFLKSRGRLDSPWALLLLQSLPFLKQWRVMPSFWHRLTVFPQRKHPLWLGCLQKAQITQPVCQRNLSPSNTSGQIGLHSWTQLQTPQS